MLHVVALRSDFIINLAPCTKVTVLAGLYLDYSYVNGTISEFIWPRGHGHYLESFPQSLLVLDSVIFSSVKMIELFILQLSCVGK